MYADDNEEYFPPLAADIGVTVPNTRGITPSPAGYWRWHGRRVNGDYPFDPRVGCMASYLGLTVVTQDEQEVTPYNIPQLIGEIQHLQGVKICPTFRSYAEGNLNTYEWGSGGYGYSPFVGNRGYYDISYPEMFSGAEGARRPMFHTPSNTIMFADCASPQMSGGQLYYAEESEIYPPNYVDVPVEYWGSGTSSIGRPMPMPAADGWGTPAPTIHFRHLGQANVLWLDGHVTASRMDFSGPSYYLNGADSAFTGVGWFGTADFAQWDYLGQ
jgi:prepilin-type processing-associated H-X9-DG protein